MDFKSVPLTVQDTYRVWGGHLPGEIGKLLAFFFSLDEAIQFVRLRKTVCEVGRRVDMSSCDPTTEFYYIVPPGVKIPSDGNVLLAGNGEPVEAEPQMNRLLLKFVELFERNQQDNEPQMSFGSLVGMRVN